MRPLGLMPCSDDMVLRLLSRQQVSHAAEGVSLPLVQFCMCFTFCMASLTGTLASAHSGCSHHQLLPPGCACLHQQDSQDVSQGVL